MNPRMHANAPHALIFPAVNLMQQSRLLTASRSLASGLTIVSPLRRSGVKWKS
jgi:hypothetical protein